MYSNPTGNVIICELFHKKYQFFGLYLLFDLLVRFFVDFALQSPFKTF